MTATRNAVGGKGPWGGHDDVSRNDKAWSQQVQRQPLARTTQPQGFDFLGCHLHKRMSVEIWEAERERVYVLQRWPSTTSVKRVKQRVKELTPGAACHRDLRETIAKINPVIRGWGGYFATGNASTKFNRSTAMPGCGYASTCVVCGKSARTV